jgi:acyl carrier protein
MSQIEGVLKTYIREQFMFNRQEEEFTRDYPLIDEGVIDSLGIFLLIDFIKQKFDVTILPDDVVLENFKTVGAIIDLINSRK